MLPEELRKLFKHLSEISTTKEYDGIGLNEYLANLWDKASAKEAVQIANKDLTRQRDEWKAKERGFKEELEQLKTQTSTLSEENKKLISSQLSEEQKSLLSRGLSPEMEAIMNTLKKTVEEQGTQMRTLQETLQKTAQEKEAARQQADQEALNGTLTQALMQHKIKEPGQISAALALINAKKMAQIEHDDNGTTKHIFSYTENGKPYAFGNAEELAKYVAEKNQYLVSASGKPGGGSSYTPQGNEHTSTYSNAKNLNEFRSHAASQFAQLFKTGTQQ